MRVMSKLTKTKTSRGTEFTLSVVPKSAPELVPKETPENGAPGTPEPEPDGTTQEEPSESLNAALALPSELPGAAPAEETEEEKLAKVEGYLEETRRLHAEELQRQADPVYRVWQVTRKATVDLAHFHGPLYPGKVLSLTFYSERDLRQLLARYSVDLGLTEVGG